MEKLDLERDVWNGGINALDVKDVIEFLSEASQKEQQKFLKEAMKIEMPLWRILQVVKGQEGRITLLDSKGEVLRIEDKSPYSDPIFKITNDFKRVLKTFFPGYWLAGGTRAKMKEIFADAIFPEWRSGVLLIEGEGIKGSYVDKIIIVGKKRFYEVEPKEFRKKRFIVKADYREQKALSTKDTERAIRAVSENPNLVIRTIAFNWKMSEELIMSVDLLPSLDLKVGGRFIQELV